ncbi:MAG: reverse transcriptase domain-containing protein [Faecalibacterium sp.]|nr:reverse transcriptase domain-containing protein [Ruminococcus flavefaciens]MCM1363197.1 reverse transcriptase domain-containing protein [Clostridiales bacterium]MCM1484633.1 reverse transcriptase domain-containing protein [Faecalibacterium sp.]
MRNPIDVLSSLTEKSKNESYKFQRLYRNLYNPEFYWLAYKNIYANTGSMTAGSDGTTIDGMSNERIVKIIESLRDRSYQPKPARREYIAKKNSNKKRPLGIQSGDDKLVQEVVKMILESIYEPVFKKTSHGFRPNKSCQTALQQIQKTFTGTNWFVEGDIHACFDSFNHHTIITLLRKRIDDEAFLQLIWKFLKAGYMEQWTYNRTYSGVPQGSGVSPVLANVYLHELDKFMEDYAQTFNQGMKKQMNPEYNKALKKASYYRRIGRAIWMDLSPEERKERTSNLKKLELAQRQITPTMPLDKSFRKIRYVRYADDFIIGIIGSKADAEQVKTDVGKFLKDILDLDMSESKTKITHTSDRARFLGHDITVSRSQDLKKSAAGYKLRSNTGVVKLLVPREKWVGKLLEYNAIKIKINENGKERFVALHRGKLVNQSDIEILARYNAEVRGLYNYYSIANDSYKIGRFANLMKYSMYKTFACKYKTNVHEIKRRYCVSDLFTVAYETKAGRKTTTFYKDGFKRKEVATKYDNISELPQYSKYTKTNTLKQRVERHTCELCGKDCRNLEIHQIKKMKDLKGSAEWILLMRKKRRKTLVVCPECHKLIHS